MRSAQLLAFGRDNNFNLIRMIAASAVIVSHSFPLSRGPGAWEPFGGGPLNLGAIAVHVFFGLSGFFILKSFDNRRSNVAFVLARAARIVPALAVITTATWLLRQAGVDFTGNPYPLIVNGSLWTLWYEVSCYIGLLLVGLSGAYRGSRFLAFIIGYVAFYAVAKTDLIINHLYADLSLPFVFGMSAYHFRSRLPLHWTLALALLVLGSIYQVLPLWSLAAAYVPLWIGSIPSPLLAYNRLGDYSFGTYVAGWPVQQTIAYSITGLGPFAMMALALPIIWLLAALLWHWVERPSLERFRKIGEGLGSHRKDSALVTAKA